MKVKDSVYLKEKWGNIPNKAGLHLVDNWVEKRKVYAINISKVDWEKYETDSNVRETVRKNIDSGWLFVKAPKDMHLYDHSRGKDGKLNLQYAVDNKLVSDKSTSDKSANSSRIVEFLDWISGVKKMRDEQERQDRMDKLYTREEHRVYTLEDEPGIVDITDMKYRVV